MPSGVRCLALRSCSEQCSRRRSVSSYFCGTHNKGIPHGSLSLDESASSSSSELSSSGASGASGAPSELPDQNTKKMEVCAHEIEGIMYYLDNIKNVYSPEEIHMRKHNPKKIGTYNQIGEKYQIILF